MTSFFDNISHFTTSYNVELKCSAYLTLGLH